MFVCHPETFETYIDDENLLYSEELAVELLSESSGIHGWTPVTPGPPPLYADRNASTFIPRAPVRLARPTGMGGGEQSNPLQQDRRQTRQGETVQIVLNGLLRNGDIIRTSSQDFRLSWLVPRMAGSDAPVLTIFYDTSTGFVSYKDENGVVFAFSGSGSGSSGIDGGGP